MKRVALAEHGEFLSHLRAGLLADLEVEAVAVAVEHHAFDRPECLDEIVRHRVERRRDAVRHSGVRGRRPSESDDGGDEQEHAAHRAQNVTDG